MELQRKIRAIANKMSPSSPVKPSAAQTPVSNQGLASLVVMIVVLTIIVLFCCFSAPGIRDLCNRYVFRCVMDDPDRDNASTATESTTPTIILLPYGRMLVVDRTVFAQLQADHTGIDLMELSANLIRAQQQFGQTGSTPSILDASSTADTSTKEGMSPVGLSPPAYDDIFGGGGDKDSPVDLPPSYSEVSLVFRTYSSNIRNGNGRRLIACGDERLTERTIDEMCGGGDARISDLDVKEDVVTDGDKGNSNSSVHIDIIEESENEPFAGNIIDIVESSL